MICADGCFLNIVSDAAGLLLAAFAAMGIGKLPVDVSTQLEPTDKLQTSLNEKANESAEIASKDDAASTGTAERVKGHPVIRNGKHD